MGTPGFGKKAIKPGWRPLASGGRRGLSVYVCVVGVCALTCPCVCVCVYMKTMVSELSLGDSRNFITSSNFQLLLT